MMHRADIAIVGAGLAGASAAAMLGRTDHSIVLIDPHATSRPDFRCEKLDPSQMRLLREMGLAGLVLPLTGRSRELLVARYGRLIDRIPVDQYGILYQDLVDAIRAGVSERVATIAGAVAAIETGPERQIVTLKDGGSMEARLVVLANGLNWALRRTLGIACDVLSPVHSTTIGFDIAPLPRRGFAFDSLTYYGERPEHRTAYLTLFRLRDGMRANLMVYRTLDDAWLAAFRADPKAVLRELMPGLVAMTGNFDIVSPVRIRPADLYLARNVAMPGVVLVGDAYATSCPAAGTGTNKVLRDVAQLCAVHIPCWLSTPGMGLDKIAAFYADPQKCAEDDRSLRLARELKSVTVETGPSWRLRRAARFWGRWLKGRLRRSGPGGPAAADTGVVARLFARPGKLHVDRP